MYTRLKVLNTLTLIFMLVMNWLANALPLGGKDTGELSENYPNLFVPAGFTFAIWGIIFLLLITFVVWQWLGDSDEVVEKVGPWFAVNTIANGSWILVWHNELVLASVAVMLILLTTLILIYNKIVKAYPPISFISKVPISVYLGWISVATIANFTTLLVDNGITELGLGAANWAAIMLIIAGVLAMYMVWSRKDIFFAAVVLWASYGAYSKRIADTSSQDQIVELTAQANMAMMIIVIVAGLVLILKKRV